MKTITQSTFLERVRSSLWSLILANTENAALIAMITAVISKKLSPEYLIYAHILASAVKTWYIQRSAMVNPALNGLLELRMKQREIQGEPRPYTPEKPQEKEEEVVNLPVDMTINIDDRCRSAASRIINWKGSEPLTLQEMAGIIKAEIILTEDQIKERAISKLSLSERKILGV